MVLFAKKQQAHRAQQQRRRSRRFRALRAGKGGGGPAFRVQQRRGDERKRAGKHGLKRLARQEQPPGQAVLLHGGAALRQNAYAAEGQKRRRDAQLPLKRKRAVRQRCAARGQLQRSDTKT